jgi:hypothetical protein
LVLSVKILDRAFLTGVLGFQDLDLGFEFDIFFFANVKGLFKLNDLFIKLFVFFLDDWVCLAVRIVG